MTSISSLPDELLLPIFSGFSLSKLTNRLALVCKQWDRVSGDSSFWTYGSVRKLFREFKVLNFNKSVWEFYADVNALGLDFSDYKSLGFFLIFKEVGRFFAQLKEKNLHVVGDAGVTVLTMPKNLSFDVLEKFVTNPKVGSPVRINMEFFAKKFREETVKETYRIIITNDILSSTRSARKDILKKIVREQLGMEFPKALEAATLAAMMYIISGDLKVRFFGCNPDFTYTYCLEKLDTDHLLLGGFEDDLIDVCYEDQVSNDKAGAAAVKKIG